MVGMGVVEARLAAGAHNGAIGLQGHLCRVTRGNGIRFEGGTQMDGALSY